MSVILEIFRAALQAVDPNQILGAVLTRERGRLLVKESVFRLDDFNRILVVGAGKAAGGMGRAVEAILGDRISAGMLIMPQSVSAPLRHIAQVQAAHPLPDEAGMRASLEILELLNGADEKTLVLFLVSGGASALLAAPAAGVTLADKRVVTAQLLDSGAAIGELNAVRKHLSAVKGGRLAAAAFPAVVLTLAISDVIGDRPDVIGSGPTAADGSTFAAVWAAIEKYNLQNRIPGRVRGFLERGLAGLETETVKENDPRLSRARYWVVANIITALATAQAKARQTGSAAEIVTSALRGEARDAARYLGAKARQAQDKLQPGRKRCLLSGGETTVRVSGSGRGGRNQELALAFALEIAGHEGIEMLSAGSDGVDGPTDAAGAIVDGTTVIRAARLGLDAAAFLDNHDSYSFFCELDRLGGGQHHLKTGPTGTNVMDLQVILLRGSR